MKQVLARPWAFRTFNLLIGATRARDIFVRDHVRPTPGDRVLDIGCGIGELVPALRGVEYVGFDESPEYIRFARARYPGVVFLCERIDAHSVQPDVFDIALASGVLHHLNDREADQLLRLAHASLRPGGRFITIDPCFVDGQSVAGRFLMRRDRGRYVRTRDGYLQLIRGAFSEVTPVMREDLLRVPYTHLIVECAKTPRS